MFKKGALAMLPITPGIIPFGLVMGTVAADAGLSMFQTVAMNFIVFAGAAQLAAIELMLNQVETVVVIITGLVINLRFMLYSASLATKFANESILYKAIVSYTITDQSYTSLAANEHKLKASDKLLFYLGTSLVMIIVWQSSVVLGFIFGNFAPESISLDYAVPLSFVALVMPTLKNKLYWFVAVFCSILAIILKDLPYNLGLLVTACSGISLGMFLKRSTKNGEQTNG